MVWHTLEALGETAFFAKFPYLAWWPLKPLLSYFFEHYADAVYDDGAMLLNFVYVPLKNSAAQGAAQDALLALQKAADQFGGQSPEYLAARAKAQQAFAEHVRSLLVPA